MNHEGRDFLEKVVQGSLFTRYFLSEGVQRTSEYQSFADEAVRIQLWSLQEKYLSMRSAQAPDEADTEDDLIEPMLDALGWTSRSRQKTAGQQTGDRPDFLLFPNSESKRQAQRDRNQQYKYGIAILEAKRFERPLDRRGAMDGLDRGTPSSQILRYLSWADVASNGKIIWGILTNGRLWRLYYHEAQARAEGYLEFDLEPILNPNGPFPLSESERLEAWKLFCLFFRRDAFICSAERPSQSFLELALQEGKNYEERVTEDLKQKIFEDVFILLARGFVEDAERKSVSVQQAFLDEAYKNALTLLYRLLFILYAEDRDLLPVRDDRYDDYSLRKLRDEIERKRDEGDNFSQRATHYWDQLKNLFHIVNGGDSSINVPVYNGRLFDPHAHPFLEHYAISDYWLAQALDLLSRDHSDQQHPRRINYRDLGVRQLGSIYEGLLEFKLRIAAEDLVVVKEKGQEHYLPKAKATGKRALAEIKQGELFITNDKSERKATGSYYTPDYIVQYIVENTLGPLVQRIEEEFESKREELKALRKLSARAKTVELAEKYDPAMRVLELKVLDPAMGSGHFLVAAVDFLADRINDLLEKHNGEKYFGDELYESPLYHQIEEVRQKIRESVAQQGVKLDESKLEDKHIIKRMVMKRCIYGVDLNEMAVELAKVSLWLHSFTVGAPLSFLDHHLKWGNSLIGVFDVSDVIVESSPRYREFIQALHTMVLIGELTDATMDETRESARLFKEAKGWLEPFKRRLDASLVMEHFIELTKNRRVALQAAISQGEWMKPEIKSLLDQALQIARQKHFFHWKLEFPEVWYTERGPRENPGFDAVVGNPPYGLIPDDFIKSYAGKTFESLEYQFDHYVAFMEQAIHLAKEQGFQSFIVPTTFLSMHYFTALRHFLLRSCAIKVLVHFKFPVFDDPTVESAVYVVKVTKDPAVLQTNVIQAIVAFSLQDFALGRASNIQQARFESTRDYDFNLNPQGIDLVANLNKLSLPLEQLSNITVGIKPYQTGKGEPPQTKVTVERRVFDANCKKSETYLPYLMGRDLNRYSIDPVEPRWLSYGKWLAEPRPEAPFFEDQKILIRQTGDRIVAIIDRDQFLTLNNIHNLLLTRENLEHVFLLALLNSRLLTYCHRQLVPEAGRAFAEVKIVDLQQLPIRRIFFTTPAAERQRLVEQLKQLYQKGLEKLEIA